MTESNYLLTRFIIWLMIWLVVSFAMWYSTATVLNVPLAAILESLLVGGRIHEVSPLGKSIEVITNVPLDVGILAFDLNPLIYTYNTAFFFALVLATPTAWLSKFNQLVAGWLLILLPVQVLGLVVLTYKTLLIDFSTGFVTAGWQLDLLALGYQFTSLLLPPLLPVILWGSFNQQFLRRLVPSLEQQTS